MQPLGQPFTRKDLIRTSRTSRCTECGLKWTNRNRGIRVEVTVKDMRRSEIPYCQEVKFCPFTMELRAGFVRHSGFP
ncbi:NAD-dependent deacetylase sir2C [Dirofilaria immitis]